MSPTNPPTATPPDRMTNALLTSPLTPPQARPLPTLLVIDDNPGDIELVRIAFEMNRHAIRIEGVHDGMAAMRWLLWAKEANQLPELVLLDLNMPSMNGFEVLAFMLNEGLIDQVPVVVLSTSAQSEDRLRSLHLGAREFHTKPERIQDLLDLVGHLGSYFVHQSK
jgi:chemotaxis family two-component system response regulator Rcp1